MQKAFCLLMVGIFCLLSAGAAAAQESHPELQRLYEADQAVREGDWAELSEDSLQAIAEADARRRQRVEALLEAGEVQTAEDYFRAAIIFQHGSDSTAYRRAYELAQEAVRLDATHEEAKQLVAMAYDRWQQSLDRPQVYGTQFTRRGGRWLLVPPVDTAQVTDAERRRLGVRTNAQTKELLDCLNGSGTSLEGCLARHPRPSPNEEEQ